MEKIAIEATDVLMLVSSVYILTTLHKANFDEKPLLLIAKLAALALMLASLGGLIFLISL